MTAQEDDAFEASDADFRALLEEVAHASDIPLRSLSSMVALEPGTSLLEGRFEIVRRLGKGAMGMVYEATDRERGGSVALKMLSRADPVSVLRFKNEFRSLADAVHPRLVRLHALFNQGAIWFFTMDLIVGRNFSEHAAALEGLDSAWRAHARDAWLRVALLDICDGVLALHASGKLHRDLKPSNVLVAPDGRVTIVDFGLVTEARAAEGSPASVSGTRAYLAPERRRGQAATEASDWYAVGVMLFEALAALQPSARADDFDAAAVSLQLAHVAPDLASICRELLSTNPATRLRGPELRARLTSWHPAQPVGEGAPREPAFVGRERELQELEAAWRAVGAGRSTVCRVHGPSGFGKTRLVRQFLQRAQTQHAATVLEGRCYESEHIPYKLLDGVVDALAVQLAETAPLIQSDIAPSQLAALVRLFPVLRRVPGIERVEESADNSRDDSERRRRAVMAARALLGCLAPRSPLIIHVDDAQWADADGAQLLTMVLEATRPLLLVLSHRDDEESPALSGLFEALARAHCTIRDIAVGGLAPAELERLCRDGKVESDGAIELMVREAAGSPYFVLELAREPTGHAAVSGKQDVSSSRLQQLIAQRAAALPADALAALHTIAIAGAPIERGVLCHAVKSGDIDRALALLRSARLVRSVRTRRASLLTTYHDRVRDAVVQNLESERCRALRLCLAAAIEASCPEEIELIATHFAAAGEPERAAGFARLAGQRAASALAFERAAEWFRLALQAKRWSRTELQHIHTEFADALALAGHAAEAAAAYLHAAEGSASHEARTLHEIQAAAQWFCSGRLEQGIAWLRRSLESDSKPLPPAEHMVLLSKVAAGRALPLRHFANYLRSLPESFEALVRMLKYLADAKGESSSEDGARCDAWYWSSLGTIGLEAGDLNTYLVFRQLLEALRAGDPFRLARASHFTAAMGTASQSRFALRMAKLSSRVAAFAETRTDDPRPRFFLEHRLAWAAFFAFDPERTYRHADAARQLARGCHGVERELTLMELCASHAPLHRGDVVAYAERLDRFRAEGERRRDEFSMNWAVVMDHRWLLTGEHVEHLRNLQALRLRVEPRRAMMLNLWVQLEQEIALAERASGAAQSALDRLEQLLPSIHSAGIWQVARNRAQVLGQTVASLLAVAATRPASARKALLKRAEALLAQSPAPKAWLAVHRAGIAYQRGRTDQALGYLETAAATTNTDEAWLLSLSARRTLGVLRAEDRMIRDSESNLSAICTTADLRYIASFLVSGIPVLDVHSRQPSGEP